MITRVFASIVTITAMGMAAVAAWDRGGTWIDRTLLVTLSMTICLGTHLIPALSRHKAALLLWAGCLVGTVYGHVNFFVNSGIRAGLVRAQTSVPATGTEQQLNAVRAALAGISARPVATVAAELSRTRRWPHRQALEVELAEAERAAQLNDELVRLSATASTAGVMATENPVTSRVARVTGSNAASIDLVSGLGLSILLELVGAFLWWEVLKRSQNGSSGTGILAKDPIADLREAVSTGRCKLTVAGIREFMGCGQARAMELRRQMIEQGAVRNNGGR